MCSLGNKIFDKYKDLELKLRVFVCLVFVSYIASLVYRKFGNVCVCKSCENDSVFVIAYC